MESTPVAPGRFHKKGRWILLGLALVAGSVYGFRACTDVAFRGPARQRAVARVVPDSLRIRIEVLNASGIRGLARQATFHLRDLGFDVVSSGNSAERFDSTLVLVRSGRMDWAELAAQALGGARIEARPDSSRYLDLTILIGARWRPPAEAFHP